MALFVCAALVAAVGWVFLRLILLGLQGFIMFGSLVGMGFSVLILFAVLPRIWRVFAGRDGGPMATMDPPAHGPPAALFTPVEVPTASDEAAIPSPPSPDGPPVPKPPGASAAEWVTAAGCVTLAALSALVPLAMLEELLQPSGAGVTWVQFIVVAIGAAAVSLGLLAAAKYALTISRNEWIRVAAARGRMCGKCGYDLRAARGICPECGAPVAQVESAEQIAARLRALVDKEPPPPREGAGPPL